MRRGDMYALHKTVEAFVALVLDNRETGARVDEWGPKEILSHLVFWHETYVYLVRVRLSGEEPVLFTGPFRVLNARSVAENASQPPESLAERFLTAQLELERLAALCESKPVEIRIKEGSMERSLPQLVAAVEGHIRGHEERLRREIRRAAKVRTLAAR